MMKKKIKLPPFRRTYLHNVITTRVVFNLNEYSGENRVSKDHIINRYNILLGGWLLLLCR